MSVHNELVERLSFAEDILSNYNPNNSTSYIQCLGIEMSLDLHCLTDYYNDNDANALFCDQLLGQICRRYLSRHNSFFYSTRNNSAIYKDSEIVFSDKDIISPKHKDKAIDIFEKSKDFVRYSSSKKSFEGFISIIKNEEDDWKNLPYYSDISQIGSILFASEEECLDNFSKIKRGDNFMKRRLEAVSPCLNAGTLSENLAYIVSENLSKKYCDEAIDIINAKSYKLRHVLDNVKKRESNGVQFSDEYKSYLENKKSSFMEFAASALSKKTGQMNSMNSLIRELMIIDKGFCLDIVGKANMLNYRTNNFLKDFLVK